MCPNVTKGRASGGLIEEGCDCVCSEPVECVAGGSLLRNLTLVLVRKRGFSFGVCDGRLGCVWRPSPGV